MADTPRPASAAAAGAAAFSGNVFLLALPATGIVPSDVGKVFPYLGFFFGIVLLTAGVIEYVGGRGYTGVVYVTFSGFWLSNATLVFLTNAKVVDLGDSASTALAINLVPWLVLVGIFLVGSLWTNLTVFLIMLVLEVAIALFIAGYATGGWLLRAGAWMAVLDGVLGWYLTAAVIINELAAREVIPLGRLRGLRGDARAAEAPSTA